MCYRRRYFSRLRIATILVPALVFNSMTTDTINAMIVSAKGQHYHRFFSDRIADLALYVVIEKHNTMQCSRAYILYVDTVRLCKCANKLECEQMEGMHRWRGVGGILLVQIFDSFDWCHPWYQLHIHVSIILLTQPTVVWD